MTSTSLAVPNKNQPEASAKVRCPNCPHPSPGMIWVNKRRRMETCPRCNGAGEITIALATPPEDNPWLHLKLKGKAAIESGLVVVDNKPQLTLPPGMAERFAARKAEQRFKPSAEQSAFYDEVKIGTGNIILRACAGAGKTTTLINGLEYMEGYVFFGAFGKDAAEDIRVKAHTAGADRKGIRMSTMHAAGYGQFMSVYPHANVDMNKVSNIVDTFADQDLAESELIKQNKAFICKLVSFGKQFLIQCQGYPNIGNMAEWLRLCDHFSVDQLLVDDITLEKAISWVQDVYLKSLYALEHTIDFDDMLLGPIYKNMRFFRNDWIIGDEWQDANAARREIAKRLLKPGGRAVFVGDDRQSIFGFTGADSDSLNQTSKMFNCKEMFLSVSYRCSRNVIDFVKKIDPEYQIQPFENARDGLVRPIKYSRTLPGPTPLGDSPPVDSRPWFIQDPPSKTDAILCRYTKPLIANAYAMIKAGVACKVEGRDLGKGLISLARMWKISTIARLEQRLGVYLAREIQKARKAQSERKEQEVEDKVGSLMIFIERCRLTGKTKIDDLVVEIESLFADNVRGMVTLSTGHKAKGREWMTVYWLQALGSGRISKPWEELSERNVKIVIGTRAMSDLILVPESIYNVAEK